jgi:hypothetical protein
MWHTGSYSLNLNATSVWCSQGAHSWRGKGHWLGAPTQGSNLGCDTISLKFTLWGGGGTPLQFSVKKKTSVWCNLEWILLHKLGPTVHVWVLVDCFILNIMMCTSLACLEKMMFVTKYMVLYIYPFSNPVCLLCTNSNNMISAFQGLGSSLVPLI